MLQFDPGSKKRKIDVFAENFTVYNLSAFSQVAYRRQGHVVWQNFTNGVER